MKPISKEQKMLTSLMKDDGFNQFIKKLENNSEEA